MRRLVWMAGVLTLLILTACSSAEPTLLPTPILPTQVGSDAPQPTTAPELLPTEAPSDAPSISAEEPTPTLAATAEPSPTPLTLPDLDPPIATPSAALPTITRDLLFIGDGDLRFWDAELGRVDTILTFVPVSPPEDPPLLDRPNPGDIIDYSVSDSGRAIVASQLRAYDTVTDTLALDSYDLIHVDLSDRNPRTLLRDVANLRDFAISGDGRYALALTTNPELATLESPTGDVLLIDIGSGQVTQVASCEGGCFGVAWHPDSKNVVWGDSAEGVMWLNVEGDTYTPQLILANVREEPATYAIYGPIEFSRSGQFLLANQAAFEGSQRAVIDVTIGQAYPVPFTGFYVDPAIAQVTWMADNRLFVVRPDMPNSPIAEIYRPMPEQGGLVLEEQRVLDVVGAYPLGADHLENGRFGFALIQPNGSAESGLYMLKGLDDDLDRANSALPLPPSWDATSVWSPDATGAILKQDSAVFYGATFGTDLVDMRSVLGEDSHHFRWLPPRPQ